ncbi:MAG: potassium channel family protein [Xenococcaceae cyanobacterium]
MEKLVGVSQTKLDRFLVCGLGSLGQCCVVALKEFGVSIVAIELVQPDRWEIVNLPDLLDELIVGDCSQTFILEQAKIHSCRAALLVTSNESINIETALAIRQLNPHTRLVVRSAKENLNQLLSQQLGNFIAYESTQLPATAFALAAFGSETLGVFKLDGQKWQIVKCRIDRSSTSSYLGRPIYDLNSSRRQILTHARHDEKLSTSFYRWESDRVVDLGDTLVYLETAEQSVSQTDRGAIAPKRSKRAIEWRKTYRSIEKFVKKPLSKFWQLNFQQQVRRVAFIYGVILFLLLPIGTLLFYWYYPDISLIAAFSATAILLLGGYGDLFGNLSPTTSIPWWLQLFSFLLALVGTAFVGVLYALITEALLSFRFQLVKRRPQLPQQNHIVIVGFGRIGQSVAKFLQEFQKPIVAITFNTNLDREILPQVPLISGNVKEALAKANLATAKSIVIVTDDEILNLEVALMARSIAPHLNLVIRTAQRHLNDRLSQLLPFARVLFPDATAAEVFVGAAFGENIINLFHLNERSILVTEYKVESGDTLNGFLIAEIACGYGVIPILYQKPNNSSVFLPSEDSRLAEGDRLVVLATSDALQRIERGTTSMYPKQALVRIEKVSTADAAFEGANTIARISGCSLSLARKLIDSLPQTLPTLLYRHQAQRLVRELSKIFVQARIIN